MKGASCHSSQPLMARASFSCVCVVVKRPALQQGWAHTTPAKIKEGAGVQDLCNFDPKRSGAVSTGKEGGALQLGPLWRKQMCMELLQGIRFVANATWWWGKDIKYQLLCQIQSIGQNEYSSWMMWAALRDYSSREKHWEYTANCQNNRNITRSKA